MENTVGPQSRNGNTGDRRADDIVQPVIAGDTSPSDGPSTSNTELEFDGLFAGLHIAVEEEVIKITSPKHKKKSTIANRFSDDVTNADDSEEDDDVVVSLGGCVIDNPVRKKSSTSQNRKSSGEENGRRVSKEGFTWQFIGTYRELKQTPCRRIYAKDGRSFDLALFFHNSRFYVMDAWCSHMGGPLFQGEIEDYNGKCHVMCPWHSYMFDLATGKNEIGLKQEVHEMKYDKGDLYVYYHSTLSLKPFHKDSVASIAPEPM